MHADMSLARGPARQHLTARMTPPTITTTTTSTSTATNTALDEQGRSAHDAATLRHLDRHRSPRRASAARRALRVTSPYA
jgi:hypothetical protein